MVTIASAPKPTPASPNRVTPTPIWASAAPQNDSGSPAARRNATPAERPGRQTRMPTSVSVPRMAKIAIPAAIDARIEPPPSQTAPAIAASAPATTAAPSRWTTPRSSPRFQASEKPTGVAAAAVRRSTPQVMLKNGAPTVIFSPVSSSRASG